MSAFSELGLSSELMLALNELGYEEPTPIQEQAIPALKDGHDVIGQAQTGTGKTAAFGLPLLDYLDPSSDETQAIVLTPTRELCIQVTQALRAYAEHIPVEVVAVFGGAPVREQSSRVRSGAHVVVATVGRMKDLIARQALVLTAARYVVLDEADEMLDLGFIEDVERILKLCPSGRQTSLFSATIPAPVARLAERYMYDPVTIRIEPQKLTVDAIEQAFVEVERREKTTRLIEVLKAEEPEQAIVFCRTKITTARLDRELRDRGVMSKALHGDMSQGQRDGVMISFKEHRSPLLVATDVASRGLDIEHVTHVVNYDVPDLTDSYVHRIGRTGRVGRTGRAITFVTPEQRDEIGRIEREARVSIGEWEAPEDRIEHAPRPRRRDHSADRPKRARTDSTKDAASPGQGKAAGPEKKTTSASTSSAPRDSGDGAAGADATGSDDGERASDADGDKPAKLFLNRGRRSGIDPDDVRWALVEGAVIPEDAIGSINVLDRFSFVELDAKHADEALERLDGTKLKGKQIRLEYARA